MTTWEDFKVDLPLGKHGDVAIGRINIFPNSGPDIMYRLEQQVGVRGRSCPAGQYTALYRNGELWMSDTRAEIRDQEGCFRQVRRRGGRILVNGLGLGMFVKACLALPNVTHVDVVDIDPDVVALIGPHYESERCTIHLADAYEIQWPVGSHWTVAWHDIWQTIGTANGPEITRLKRKYGSRADYQEAWVKGEVKRMKDPRSMRNWDDNPALTALLESLVGTP